MIEKGEPKAPATRIGNFFARIKTQVRTTYRLVVMNDTSLEEQATFLLTPMNLFVFMGATLLFLIVSVTYLIAFTGLREYIPGYADTGMRRKLIEVSSKVDSLEASLAQRDLFVKNLHGILSGGTGLKHDEGSKLDSTRKSAKIPSGISSEDSLLRAQIAAEEQLGVESGSRKKGGIHSFFFFPPVKGVATHRFMATPNHLGVDIATAKGEPVKAILEGTIIFSGYTKEGGYMIQIQHGDNLVSIYKHNSMNLKKEGDRVKAGDPIAMVGNTGEQSTGPHLHLELWHKGFAVDPQDFIQFK